MEIIGNPLLEKFNTPFGTLPLDRIETECYEPAFDEGIKQLEEEISKITAQRDEPTFGNTIVALERCGRLLDCVSSAFYNVLNADANDAMMDISQRIAPKLSESTNNIYLNEKLFQRVKYVYDNRESLSLDVEDARLLEETYTAFKNRGAVLSPEKKAEYRKLSSELDLLTLQFEQNALKDKNRFELHLQNKSDIAGLPESICESAAALAKEKGKEKGWLFNLSAPSYIPFMQYAENRALREKLYRAYMNIGNKNDEFDNKSVICQIVNIRLAIANLLGYPTYADYRLEHTMAKSPANVYQLLNGLLAAYKPVALDEYREIRKFAAECEHSDDFEVMPWDWSYYSEKLKHQRFNVNDEMTRPYFRLDMVVDAVFELATELYGVTFKENKSIPVYNPEVCTYEVYDADGSFLAILYADFFPRDGKQSGAWMNNLKSQYRNPDGTDSRPHIIIVTNFTRPTADKPSLLTFAEVETFLHEFGHALHGILAKGRYASLSGTNVYHDFVELPSQFMENWLREKFFLNRVARHYQTGEKIPDELVHCLIDSSNFNAGYRCCRQLSFGYLDMAWHSLKHSFDGDVSAFEREAWKDTQILPDAGDTLMSSQFGHIFSGGYAAGYYGYKWAEVLDADAFAAFREEGVLNKAVAARFRQLLSAGGAEDPMSLYLRFRGKAPSIEALLQRDGISK